MIIQRYNAVDKQWLANNEPAYAASPDGTLNAAKGVAWSPTADGSTWYHVAMAYDASAGTVDFWIDGSHQTQQTGTGRSERSV